MALRAARVVFWTCAVAAAAALVPGAAAAVPVAGIDGATDLVTFDTATPSTDVRFRPISGLQSAGETAIGLDTRPATGGLYLFTVPTVVVASALVRTYQVDPVTARATFVGSIPNTVPLAGDRPSGSDFQPLIDRVRVVQANNENFRLNPANGGLSGDDANLTFTPPATGPVAGAAYDRNVAPGPPGTPAPAGAHTTLYEIDAGSDRLVVQGGIDGAGPGGVNGGGVTSVGALGVPVDNASDAGFDIATDGTAYASLRSGGVSRLYTVNLGTGAATLQGTFPLGLDIRALTVLAPDNCPLVTGDDQADQDADGIGDACDADIDGDGVSNDAEATRGTDPRNPDSDGDGKSDGVDACPTIASGEASGCPAPAAPAAPLTPPLIDTTAATITISGAPSRVARKKFFNGISARLSAGEGVSFDVALLGKARSAGLARTADVVLATKSFGLSTATRSLKLKPKRSLVGGRKSFTVRLQVIATDAAGNRSTKTKTIRVG